MTKKEYFFQETNIHIRNVQLLMNNVIQQLINQARLHDVSKFDEDEADLFAEVSPELSKFPYGSEEYKENLRKIKPAIDHHNLNNFHHPENHARGITGMNLIDIIEMICDWVAASKRNPNGNTIDSIEKNQKRFGYSDELKQVLINTVYSFGTAEQLLEAHNKYCE